VGYIVSIELTAVGPDLRASVGTMVKDLCSVCADKLNAFLNCSQKHLKKTEEPKLEIQLHFDHTSL
jgi:hypothetical protein